MFTAWIDAIKNFPGISFIIAVIDWIDGGFKLADFNKVLNTILDMIFMPAAITYSFLKIYSTNM